MTLTAHPTSHNRNRQMPPSKVNNFLFDYFILSQSVDETTFLNSRREINPFHLLFAGLAERPGAGPMEYLLG